MCRALTVLCAAPDPERLAVLKRASVSATWELVGGASSLSELSAQAAEWEPDVVVLDGALGEDAVRRVREIHPRARIVVVGDGKMAGADEAARSPDEVRSAILGIPRPGGPVRG